MNPTTPRETRPSLRSRLNGGAMRRVAAAIGAAVTLIASLAAAPSVAQPTPSSPEVERWRVEWPNTNFKRTRVKYPEIIEGGPPKDGIPAVINPGFFPAKQVVTFSEREAVVALEIDGEARAYPLRYLIWHQIVNDEIKGRPVAVTFCPLSNAAIAFDRTYDEHKLLFGVSGKLRNSNMIMYDRQTKSWWQQFTGEAIVGDLAQERLTQLPATVMSWGAYRRTYPEGLVMAQPTKASGRYGQNPYAGYDSAPWPTMYEGEKPPHEVPPMSRVVRVGDSAWPLERLASAGELVEAGYRLTWTQGQASALDSPRVGEGREVGDVRVYEEETGAPAPYQVPFAFTFFAFEPDGEWMNGGN